MLAYLFVILAVAVRFLPHPWHFTPVAASLLFFGAYGSRRSMWFPVALLAGSDVILTKFVYAYPFSWDHLVTWVWYGAVVLLGTQLRDHAKAVWIVASALASSVSFFLLSNFAVWAAFDMYPKNFSGLMTSYVAGLPFFQRGAVGDLIFTVAFFATPVLLSLPQGSEKSSSREAV
jgi:Family of unknown function (DUF6580)